MPWLRLQVDRNASNESRNYNFNYNSSFDFLTFSM